MRKRDREMRVGEVSRSGVLKVLMCSMRKRSVALSEVRKKMHWQTDSVG